MSRGKNINSLSINAEKFDSLYRFKMLMGQGVYPENSNGQFGSYVTDLRDYLIVSNWDEGSDKYDIPSHMTALNVFPNIEQEYSPLDRGFILMGGKGKRLTYMYMNPYAPNNMIREEVAYLNDLVNTITTDDLKEILSSEQLSKVEMKVRERVELQKSINKSMQITDNQQIGGGATHRESVSYVNCIKKGGLLYERSIDRHYTTSLCSSEEKLDALRFRYGRRYWFLYSSEQYIGRTMQRTTGSTSWNNDNCTECQLSQQPNLYTVWKRLYVFPLCRNTSYRLRKVAKSSDCDVKEFYRKEVVAA